jgi:hypothetical protein
VCIENDLGAAVIAELQKFIIEISNDVALKVKEKHIYRANALKLVITKTQYVFNTNGPQKGMGRGCYYCRD